ncbi:MAG: FKBP-type peptidyl-prolyl cis-trans isomerase FkpA [Saprospiraceae bacterium]|jgi:FKBP-type peptidyl-prolyl cis-trans isomerase FkpA
MLKNLFFTLTILSIFACGNAPQESQITSPVEEKKEITDDLVMRLSMEMVASPSTQVEQDKNTIINYAIDNNLDVQMTQKGLFFLIEKEGEGDLLKWGDKISVNYTGQFLDDKIFDSTKTKGDPMSFYIGNMIDGWNEGLQLLRPGGKAIFLVPSALAYGEKGLKDKKERDIIPVNSVLRFDIEVIEKLKK